MTTPNHRSQTLNNVSPNFVSRNFVSDKHTTLSPDYKCDKCGEPAMTNEGGALRCPSCWLREKGQQIKKLDHDGYRP
jgi:lipopolysaccharide biosynthesis regulator YciM